MERFRPIRLLALLLAVACLPACRTTGPVAPAPEPPAVAGETPPLPDDEEAYRQIRLFTAALVQIRRGHVDETKTGYQDLLYGALRGMLNTLDPHSQFLEPQAYQQVKDDTSGEFSGIGIVIGAREGVLTVISPIEDTPAFKAGVQPNDKILEIDGKSTEGLSVPDSVKRLRGERGTPVKLKLLSAGSQETRTVELVRDTVKVTSVKGARHLEPGIAYVRVTQFTETTATDLKAALEKLHGEPVRAFVLDLRNNPGGLLSSAIGVAELFLPRQAVIVSTRGRHTLPPPLRASGRDILDGIPLAVLVNAGSASASEIVAGALQDHKRAVLVGDSTFGKASVQSLFALDDKSAIRLTTARYYTPSGRLIHEVGIQPDIVAPIPPDEWQKVLIRRAHEETPGSVDPKQLESAGQAADIQLERAVDLLKGILVFQEKR